VQLYDFIENKLREQGGGVGLGEAKQGRWKPADGARGQRSAGFHRPYFTTSGAQICKTVPQSAGGPV